MVCPSGSQFGLVQCIKQVVSHPHKHTQIQTHTHTPTHIHTQIHTHTHTHTHTNAHTHTHTHTHREIQTHTHTHTHTHCEHDCLSLSNQTNTAGAYSARRQFDWTTHMDPCNRHGKISHQCKFTMRHVCLNVCVCVDVFARVCVESPCSIILCRISANCSHCKCPCMVLFQGILSVKYSFFSTCAPPPPPPPFPPPSPP